MYSRRAVDPFQVVRLLWPDVTLYDKQAECLRSAFENDETYVPAGNMLGKDFVAALIVLAFFLTRHPCRIITTSAKADHLRVLWGEIGEFIRTASMPLTVEAGGPLVCNHFELRRCFGGTLSPKCYVRGLVASQDSIASMQGHHIADVGDGIPRTMFMSDESSSVSDAYYTMATTWANRLFIFGNPWPCDNFFRRGVQAGDMVSPDGSRHYRRVIRIAATDSPNVKLGLVQRGLGLQPTGEMLIPGVKSYGEYLRNLAMWDKRKQTVSLDGEFYEGSEVRMFPVEWLDAAKESARRLIGVKRVARTIGVDPAEGGDRSAWSVVDEQGLIHMESKRTPDTNVIPFRTLELMRQFGVAADRVYFDRGGGGKEHADRMRAMGHRVRTIGFGESPNLDPKRGLQLLEARIDVKEERSASVNRRSEMYSELRSKLDPVGGGFALPAEYTELFRQLGPIPLTYDGEGRLKLPPKNRRTADSTEVCLTDLIGCSPDEADSLVLAVHGLTARPRARVVVG